MTDLNCFACISYRSECCNFFPSISSKLRQFELSISKSCSVFIYLDDYDFIIWIPVICIFCTVNIVWLINSTCYSVSTYSTWSCFIFISIFGSCYFCRSLGLDKFIAVNHSCFLNDICCPCWKVEET